MELTKEERAFLLEPKSLPSNTHYLNLRLVLKAAMWTKLRKAALAEANSTCMLCHKKPKRLELHEVWAFDFIAKMQTLVKLVILCHYCHRLQHVNLLILHHDQGITKIERVVKHYNALTGNHLGVSSFLTLAARNYEQLEAVTWEVDLISFLKTVAH